MDRRTFLACITAGTTTAVAGCSSGDETTTATDTGTDTSMSGDDPTATATDTGTDTATAATTDTRTATDQGTATDSPTETATAEPDVAAEVAVAANNELKFAPASVTVQQGETVRWVWQAGGHNVKPDDIPSESDWTGSPGGRSETQPEGFEYEHTFEVTGQFDYVCVPHQDFGMEGTVVVE